MGLVSASAAKAASERTRPGWDQASRMVPASRADPGQVQQLGNLCCRELAQLGHVGGQVPAKGVDPAGEADCFAPTRCDRGVFVAGPPAGNRSDLGAGQGLSCVNTKVDAADQRGQSVDDLGALSAHLVSRGDQHPDRGPGAGDRGQHS